MPDAIRGAEKVPRRSNLGLSQPFDPVCVVSKGVCFMFQPHRQSLVGLGIDLLTAIALTGVAIVFHMVAHHGLVLGAVESLFLAFSVLAILTGYNWAFNKATGIHVERS